MIRYWDKSKSLVGLAAGLGLGLLVGVGMMIGAMHASQHDATPSATNPAAPEGLPLEAETAAVGKNISIATGSIDGEVEGVFVLDHLTGRLSCFVVNPRALNTLLGQFQADVLADLGLEKGKDPDYVITVGRVNPVGRGTSARPALCIVYVADGNTGNVAGYSLLWNTTSAKSSQPQVGPLVRVMLTKARPNVATE